MRIWDLPPQALCKNHLLGEHRELHAVWAVITEGKTGYRHHPETRRWVTALKGLYERHARLVREMNRRGYAHRSPLDPKKAVGSENPPYLIDSLTKQRMILKKKGCSCNP